MLLGGEQEQLQHHADGERRDAVRQRPAEQIAEPRRAQPAGQHVHDGLLRHQRLGLQKQRLGLIRVQMPGADAARHLIHRVDAAQVHAAQRHVAHQAQRVLAVLVHGGEYAVGDHVYVGIGDAEGAQDVRHGLLHAEDLRAVLQQNAPRVPGQLQHLAVVRHCHPSVDPGFSLEFGPIIAQIAGVYSPYGEIIPEKRPRSERIGGGHDGIYSCHAGN